MAQEETEEVNEAHIALLRSLGVREGDTAMVWEIDTEGEPDGQSVHIVVVEGELIHLVSHGWGSSGAHVDVRTYVGLEDPQQVTPTVLDLDRTVMVLNPAHPSANES